ncbi:hypothetical protein K502DRAFT_337120 [Neoconidiobolus thromboides FSU 785]|nr:hypothetical protein K502DRAFT_337120 [Neoconidiobolus thromboides FSU 785]
MGFIIIYTKSSFEIFIKNVAKHILIITLINSIVLTRSLHITSILKQKKLEPFKDEKYELIYVGPLSKTAKYLKLFSISSLILTFSLSPLIFVIDGGLSPMVRSILFGGAILTSGLSTALIHWCIHPYLTRAWVNKQTLEKGELIGNTQLLFENITIMGKFNYNLIEAGKLGSNSRLFTTHKSNGHLYYIHPEIAESNQTMSQLLNLSSGKLEALKYSQNQLK